VTKWDVNQEALPHSDFSAERIHACRGNLKKPDSFTSQLEGTTIPKIEIRTSVILAVDLGKFNNILNEPEA
jgi:hypothetical protein